MSAVIAPNRADNVSGVSIFTAINKDVWLDATGSTKSRTSLYRMGISKYIDEIQKDFYIFGPLEGEWADLQTGINYLAFVVRR